MRSVHVLVFTVLLAAACSSSTVVVLPECGGWVLDAQTGQPVAGAVVTPLRHEVLGAMDGAPATTDASGLFGFPLRMGPPPSRVGGGVMTAGVTVEVRADGYQPSFAVVDYTYPMEKRARPVVALVFREAAPLPPFLAACDVPAASRHAWTLASHFGRIVEEPWFAELALADGRLAHTLGAQLRLALQPLFKTCGLTVEQDAQLQDTWRVPLDRLDAARALSR